MKITFHGAAGVVTGSQHKLESNGATILLDCGMFQGRRKEAEQRNRMMPFPAESINAVVLSHAHIDHSGRLPLLVQEGYKGPIYATPPTIDLCHSMLRDTAHIAESDSDFVNRHHPDQPPVEPLYTMADAEATMPHFRGVPYHKPTQIEGGITMEFHDAGHILGSATTILTDGKVRLAYSGDVGRPGLPIIRDPEMLSPVDYLIMESTYGSRKHPAPGESAEQLQQVVARTIGRGGRLIIPAFAVGRTQQIVLLLHQLMDAGRLPSVPMFVDSPLAVDVTQAFRAHPECFDEEAAQFVEAGGDPFGFKRLTYVRDSEASKKLNYLKGPFIVISPSGMCEAGRVLHHLRNNVGDPKNTVLITGFQAENTLGRKLASGAKSVKIFGIPTEVRAEIQKMDALSGHADASELIDWIKPMTPGLKRIFLVHGETSESGPLAQTIKSTYGIEAIPVLPGQSFDLV